LHAEQAARLQRDDDEQDRRERLLARLVPEEPPCQQRTRRSPDKRQPEEIGLGYSPLSGSRAPFVIPKTEHRPAIYKEEDQGGIGVKARHGPRIAWLTFRTVDAQRRVVRYR
jgi:hypothetical protein